MYIFSRTIQSLLLIHVKDKKIKNIKDLKVCLILQAGWVRGNYRDGPSLRHLGESERGDGGQTDYNSKN